MEQGTADWLTSLYSVLLSYMKRCNLYSFGYWMYLTRTCSSSFFMTENKKESILKFWIIFRGWTKAMWTVLTLFDVNCSSFWPIEQELSLFLLLENPQIWILHLMATSLLNYEQKININRFVLSGRQYKIFLFVSLLAYLVTRTFCVCGPRQATLSFSSGRNGGQGWFQSSVWCRCQ